MTSIGKPSAKLVATDATNSVSMPTNTKDFTAKTKAVKMEVSRFGFWPRGAGTVGCISTCWRDLCCYDFATRVVSQGCLWLGWSLAIGIELPRSDKS